MKKVFLARGAASAVRAAAAALSVCWMAGTVSAKEPPAPPSGGLRVQCVPEGAKVMVDREPRGEAPLELQGLAPGKHIVGISARGYREELSTVTVEAGTTRTLDVSLAKATAAVLVETDPVGASVSLDGGHVGDAPVLLPAVAMGDHRVVVARPGFQQRAVDLKIENAAPQKVSVSLLTDSATLRVTSEPAGAQVLFNGVPRGETPALIERIPDGVGELEVRADGYQPAKQSVRLSAGDDETTHVVLIPKPASLRVETIPAGARVYVDNQYKGESPFELQEIDPGSHRVRVELAAYDPMARDVLLERATSKTEEFRLVPNCGSLRVTSYPAGVTVLVDGKVRGTTTAKEGATDQISDALDIPLVAAGTREVTFVSEGFFEARKTVEVGRDQTATIDVKLKRKFIPDYEIKTDENVYRGVLKTVTAEGVRLETEPGVTRMFPIASIRSRRPLTEEKPTE